MSPLVEMLPLLNRSWKVRFLLRFKRGLSDLGRTAICGSGRPRGTPLRVKVESGRPRGTPLRGKVERGRPRGTPLRGKVERAPTRDAPTGEGVGCGWNVIGPMLYSMGREDYRVEGGADLGGMGARGSVRRWRRAPTRDAPTGKVWGGLGLWTWVWWRRARTRDGPKGEGVGRVELRTTGFFSCARNDMPHI